MSRPPPPSGPDWDAAPAALDRREVMTLLFTDLVGSTRLKEDLGNAEALRLIHEHHGIVRSLLQEYPEGFEISTAGDSFFLAFRKPSDAVAFSLHLQSRLHRWNRRNRRKLLDRIGIHSGEVTVEADPHGRIRDLHGLEVDKCARVMSLGQENHILLTRFAFDNARASLKGRRIPEITEIQWASHGFYQLKGVADAVEICEVTEAGRTALASPPDSDKAKRLAPDHDTLGLEPGERGWRRWLADRRVRGRTTILGAILTAVAGLLVLTVPLLRPVSDLSYDLGYLVRPSKVPSDAVILRMDPQSEEILGQSADHRWDRRIHADLIRKLAAFGARAVVLDVWFADSSTPAEDEPLIDAVKAFGRVAVAGRVVKDVRHGVFAQDSVHGPFPGLAEVAHWGLSHYPVALDQIVRRPYRGTADRQHLAVEVARMLGSGDVPDTGGMWLNYYGPPGTFQSYSYTQVLTNQVPASQFTNRIVFVGAVNLNRPGFTAGLLNDEGATPYTRWSGAPSPGVEIVATTALNLLHHDWLRRLPPWMEVLIIAVAGMGAGGFLARFRPIPAFVMASLLGLCIALVATCLMWTTRVWFPWLILAGVQLPIALAWSALAWAEAAGKARTSTGTSLGRVDRDSRGSTIPSAQAAAPSPLPNSNAPAAPLALPGYTLIREIGHGAYGTVWLARDILGLCRAVKIVRREMFEDARPYEREFSGIQRFTPISLEHDGLVPVLHVGRDDAIGFFYYVMEAADDETSGPRIDPEIYRPRTLGSDLERLGPLASTDVLELGVALGNAVEFLHQRRLVHRDIKPANVLYIRDRPRLADIGLVAAMASPNESISQVGTRGYIAPEGPGSAAADIFSLGRLLYVAATGRSAQDFPEVPVEIEERADRECLLHLNRVWLKACHTEASHRHASAAELVRDLQQVKR